MENNDAVQGANRIKDIALVFDHSAKCVSEALCIDSERFDTLSERARKADTETNSVSAFIERIWGDNRTALNEKILQLVLVIRRRSKTDTLKHILKTTLNELNA